MAPPPVPDETPVSAPAASAFTTPDISHRETSCFTMRPSQHDPFKCRKSVSEDAPVVHPPITLNAPSPGPGLTTYLLPNIFVSPMIPVSQTRFVRAISDLQSCILWFAFIDHSCTSNFSFFAFQVSHNIKIEWMHKFHPLIIVNQDVYTERDVGLLC